MSRLPLFYPGSEDWTEALDMMLDMNPHLESELGVLDKMNSANLPPPDEFEQLVEIMYLLQISPPAASQH